MCIFLFLKSFAVFAEEDKGHYALVGYDLRTQGDFKAGTYDDEDDEDTLILDETVIDFETGFSIGYEYRDASKNDWGKAFGVMHSLARDAEAVEINGERTKLSGDVASVAMTTIYAMAIYKWEKFYIPFGISYNQITYEPPSGFNGDVTSEGGVGFIFSLGWEIDDRYLIEYGARSSMWTLISETDTTETDYGFGTLAIATLALKIKFY